MKEQVIKCKPTTVIATNQTFFGQGVPQAKLANRRLSKWHPRRKEGEKKEKKTTRRSSAKKDTKRKRVQC